MPDNPSEPNASDEPRPVVGSGTSSEDGNASPSDLSDSKQKKSIPPWVIAFVGLFLIGTLGGIALLSSRWTAQPPIAQTPEEVKKEEQAKKKAAEKEKELKPKPDFEVKQLLSLPADAVEPSSSIKPGHWHSGQQGMKSNNFNFVGEMDTQLVDAQGRPIQLDRTPYRLSSTRPVALPKTQPKEIESTFFVPHGSKTIRVQTALRSESAGSQVLESSKFFSAMPPFQYYFVVMASNPRRYSYVKVLHSTRLPGGRIGAGEWISHYQVVMPKIASPIAVPSYALEWTSVAYVLWDDVDPNLLTPEQQTAMIDWLHWGGQLIISGPQSLELLKGSFLASYLPATAGDVRTYDSDDFDELNSHWHAAKTIAGRSAPLSATEPWSGVTLVKQPDAEATPHTGNLVLERRIGRGRIAATAFRLSQRDLINWRSYDNFFNGAILRRPARRYDVTSDGDLQLSWADHHRSALDPSMTSRLRYFSRDAGNSAAVVSHASNEQGFDMDGIPLPTFDDPADPALESKYNYESKDAGGVAAWNPISECSEAARATLRVAAGIHVPERELVVWIVGIYLLIIAPLNWAFFALIGRVEWAWFFAPLFAVAYSGFVVYFAQLDIGFARSQNEVALVELQGEYPRAHVTRYTALYSSLSTTYDIDYESLSAAAQPFPVDKDFQLVTGQSTTPVTYERGATVKLDGMAISSNTTGMVQSEWMANLKGGFALTKSDSGMLQVTNQSQHALTDVAVVRRRASEDSDGDVRGAFQEGCWVGDLAAGETKPLAMLPCRDKTPFAAERTASVVNLSEESIQVDHVIQLAESPSNIEPGEVRLVGRMREMIGGMTISPEATQKRGTTIVVAHLSPGVFGEPKSDVNAARDVRSSSSVGPDVPDFFDDEKDPPEADPNSPATPAP